MIRPLLAALLGSSALISSAMAQTSAPPAAGFATSEASDPYLWLEIGRAHV